MPQNDLLQQALSNPVSSIQYTLSQAVAAALPDQAILETEDPSFDLDTFAQGGGCELTPTGPDHVQTLSGWQPHVPPDQAIQPYLINGWREVRWQGHKLRVLSTRWPEGWGHRGGASWIASSSPEIARGFFDAVCRWCAAPHGEIFVFDGGCWQRSAPLYKAIRATSLITLILEPRLREEIEKDLRIFFSSRERYRELGIPWKRGLLFTGPPGNGKTHAIKGLLNALDQTCLYVKTFKEEGGSEEGNIAAVFERARQVAPCIVVLEDLDAMIHDQNRSYFLNELDGFADNDGVVIIASTNHPERLDPAITDRPSRFDRKYLFALPAEEERRRFLNFWRNGLASTLQPDHSALEAAVEQTEGFSFAYLKELGRTAVMQWVNEPTVAPNETLEKSVILLRRQMMAASRED
jgi:hypothetical protein